MSLCLYIRVCVGLCIHVRMYTVCTSEMLCVCFMCVCLFEFTYSTTCTHSTSMWYCAYAVSTVSSILCAQELSFGELSRIEGLSGSFLTLLEKQRTVLSLSVEHLEYLM